MIRYEVLERPAGVGLKGYGRMLEELFTNMALGMFGLIADVTRVQPMASIPILVQGETTEALLVGWLKELVVAGARDQMLFMNCRVHQLAATAMSGEATGEVLDLDRHQVFRTIKAVMPHELSVHREGDVWAAQVIFEI